MQGSAANINTITRREALKAAGATVLFALSETICKAQVNEPNITVSKEKMMANGKSDIFADAFEGGQYTLPALPYAYDALKPFYDEQTLKLHHDKHHAAYVKGLNDALAKLETARKNNDFAAIKGASIDLAFNGSGHVLHTLFWHSMKPGGNNGQMPFELKAAMEQSFGSTQACQAQFAAATKAVEGSGWGVLAYEPISEKLLVLQCEKHQNLTIWGVVPMLVCDVWEHAYYLQYQNARPSWVDNFMQIANWDFAGERLAAAKHCVAQLRK